MKKMLMCFFASASSLFFFGIPAGAAQIATASAPHPVMTVAGEQVPAFDPDNPPDRLRVLVALGPSTYFLKDGAPHGLELAMLSAYERFLNTGRKKGQPPIRLQFIPVDASELLPALLGGRGELAAGLLPVTTGVTSLVSYSAPYRHDRYCVVGPRNVIASNMAELGERRIAVPSASYQQRWLNEQELAREAEGGSPSQIELLSAGAAVEPLLVGMGQEGAPLTVALQTQLELWSKAAPAAKSLFCGEANVALGWAMAKDNPGLQASVNRFFASQGAGLLTRAIAQTRIYLKPDGKARTATELTSNDKLGLFAPAFQLVAEATNMDWLLLAAIAQKETKLTPYIRTNGGPTGVMQVNPATARAMGVKNPHDNEQNILAAGRYLDYLRKQFRSQGVSEADSLYFMIGAYNAGEGRMQQLRRKASAQGLDPNRWVGHVEKVAQTSVGGRMVDYVASVNRIYLAYKAAEASKARRGASAASAASAEK